MSAWLAYLCAIQGHIVNGVSNGTGAVLWSGYCSRCGASVRAAAASPKGNA